MGGAYFSGRMRWRKDTGSTASQPSHLSDTTCRRGGRAEGRVGEGRRHGSSPPKGASCPAARPSEAMSLLPYTPPPSPPAAHLDKVLGRERLGHGQREGDQVVVLSQRFLQQEVLVVQQVLCGCGEGG